MSAQVKYTDRDVREDAHLTALAEEYLEEYSGEFEFLIDCKMRLASGMDLTVGMIRGVLNCMRVDPRLKIQLPDPRPIDSKVVDLFPPRTKKTKRLECPLKEAGIFHLHKRHDYNGNYLYCDGLFRINRSDFQIDATLKSDLYVVSKSGAFIHKPTSAWFMWRVFVHKEGYYANDFYVRTECNYPRVIKNPLLFKTEQTNKVIEDADGDRMLCPRCFTEQE